MSLEGDGHRHPPPGIFGGKDGYPGAAIYITKDGEEIPLPSKLQDVCRSSDVQVEIAGEE